MSTKTSACLQEKEKNASVAFESYMRVGHIQLLGQIEGCPAGSCTDHR